MEMKDSKLKRKLVAAYEVFYEARRMAVLRTKYHLRIMSPERTLRYIKKHQCSIARFGDVEFDIICSTRDLHFQTRNEKLAAKLSAVLETKDKRLLLCVPRCFNTTRGCNAHSKTFWIEWGKRDNHHQQIINLIRAHTGPQYLFGDSQITRPYIDWVDSKRAERTFPMLKALWAGRDVLIVEGEQTRLGVGNDLYDDAASIKRILAPAVGAFEHYDEIKQAILDNYHGELIIMALGPTATVLAADLAAMDMQALDIGNTDIEYEWFRNGAKERIAIPGKFTNEATGGREVADCQDKKYLSQIIARIGC